jgi:hypothetical protein
MQHCTFKIKNKIIHLFYKLHVLFTHHVPFLLYVSLLFHAGSVPITLYFPFSFYISSFLFHALWDFSHTWRDGPETSLIQVFQTRRRAAERSRPSPAATPAVSSLMLGQHNGCRPATSRTARPRLPEN